MGFKADSAAINGLSRLMGRASDGAEQFTPYLDGPNELGDGLLSSLTSQLDALQDIGRGNTVKAGDLAKDCAGVLRKVAVFYREIDDEAAARFDRAYPEARSGRVGAEEGWNLDDVNAFEDFVSVPDYYGPTDVKSAPDDWPFAIDKEVAEIAGKTSVVRHVRDFMLWLTGIDPFEEIVRCVSGEWTLLLQQAMAFDDTGRGFDIIQENVKRGRYAIQDRWEGNAAAAAENWLAEYWQACVDHAEFMKEASWKIKNFAKSSYHSYVRLNIQVDFLLDTVLDAMTRFAAGPVGGTVISIIRGDNPFEAVASVAMALGQISTILDVLRTLVNEMQSTAELIAANGEVIARAWPVEPYAHPGVS